MSPGAKRIAATAGLALAGVAVAWLLHSRGFAAAGWAIAALSVAGAIWVWKRLGHRPADSPMISLVLLLSKPRYLEPVILAEMLRSAWGITFHVSKEGEESIEPARARPFIVHAGPTYMVATGDNMFIVHNHERLYFDDVEGLRQKVPDLRLRKIIEDHRAWLSVDALGVDRAQDATEIYRRIARALAELGDDSVLGLFQPETSRLTPWEPELAGRLRRGEGLAELFAVQQAPVVQISSDDPRMKAAVAEAQRRWPEFIAAFKARQPGGNYAVKAAVTRNGRTEFIWLDVVGLEPEYIHGKLANDPVDLDGLKLGDQVEVPLSELNDWSFRHTEDGELAGLFTVKVVTEAYAQQLKEAKGVK